MNDVANVLNIRDRCFSELPYLAQWMARASESVGKQRKLLQQINSGLLPLIHDAKRLNELIVGTNRTTDELALNAILKSTDGIAARLDDLVDRFVNHCRSLATSKKLSAESLNEMEAALCVPLIPWEIRGELRRNYSEMAERIYPDLDKQKIRKRGCRFRRRCA